MKKAIIKVDQDLCYALSDAIRLFRLEVQSMLPSSDQFAYPNVAKKRLRKLEKLLKAINSARL